MVILGEGLKSFFLFFLYYQCLNDFQKFWGSIFLWEDQDEFDVLCFVGKLNEKLYKYFYWNVGFID